MKIFLEKGISHLDLHGTKHNDVDAEILDFTYQYQDQLPLIIICGNSNKMIEIASAIRADGRIEEFLGHRYSSWNSDLGKNIRSGSMTLKNCRDHAAASAQPALESGRQEMLENIINSFLR